MPNRSIERFLLPTSMISAWRTLTPILTLSVFALDCFTPSGLSHGILYVVPLLMSAMSLDRQFVTMTLAVSVFLTALGFFFSPPGDLLVLAVANRILASMTLIIVTGLVLIGQRNFFRLVEANRSAVEAWEALRSAQRLLKIGGKAAKLGGWSVDLKSGQIFRTEEASAIHEIDPGADLSLESGFSFFPPAHQQRLRELFAACERDGIPYDEEFEFVTPAGNRKWIRTIAEAVRDESGTIVAVQGAFQDVTEWYALREKAEIGEEKFRQLAEAMPFLVWTATQDGVIDYANKAFYEYIGDENIDIEAGGWTSALHPGDVDRCLAAWKRAVESGQPYRIEYRIFSDHHADHRWNLIEAKPSKDRSAGVTRWYGTAVDIHDQKHHEEELRELSERLTDILESITDAFFTVDRQWVVRYANQQYLVWHGLEADTVVGRMIWELFPHACQMDVYKALHQAMREQRRIQLTQFLPVADRWATIHVYPSRDGLSIRMEDVTEQREIQSRIQQSQRLEAVGQLSGGIAHDFNNLLTVILGNTEALADALPAETELGTLADLTLKAALRGADLTDRLLAFARQQPLDPKPTNINQLINRLEPLLRRSLGEDIDIDIVGTESAASAMVDAPQLESALLNLCINARDAMPDGGKLSIEIASKDLDQAGAAAVPDLEAGDYVTVNVVDTGIGMTADVLRRAFDPFFTTKPVGKGSGLGLSMVYGFALQSKGAVDIKSTVGKGTAVTLYIPRSKHEETPRRATIRGPLPRGDERILLVEDDDIVRGHVAAQLASLGYDVTVARDGPSALELLRADSHFDLLFTDVVMAGGIGGKQLADEARSIRQGIKVLFTSGYSEDAIVHGGRLDPGVKLLRKPYRKADLARKIRYALD